MVAYTEEQITQGKLDAVAAGLDESDYELYLARNPPQ